LGRHIGSGFFTNYAGGEFGIYLCPTFALKTVCSNDYPVWSYRMNTNCSGLNLYGVRDASAMILLADAYMSNSVQGADAACRPAMDTNQMARIHNGQGTMVFVDGHADRW